MYHPPCNLCSPDRDTSERGRPCRRERRDGCCWICSGGVKNYPTTGIAKSLDNLQPVVPADVAAVAVLPGDLVLDGLLGRPPSAPADVARLDHVCDEAVDLSEGRLAGCLGIFAFITAPRRDASLIVLLTCNGRKKFDLLSANSCRCGEGGCVDSALYKLVSVAEKGGFEELYLAPLAIPLAIGFLSMYAHPISGNNM